MDSSPGFGSSACDKRRLGLAFAMAPGKSPLTKPHTANSLARSTKSTQSHKCAPTPFRHRVSGLFHSPHRGAFHLSLAVLVHYRSRILFSLGWWSTQVQAGFHVSDPTQEYTQRKSIVFTDGAITLCGGPFQAPLVNNEPHCRSY
jgi:hypothetical protein